MSTSDRDRSGVFPARRPLYYYITDRKQIPSGRLPARVRRLVRWGVDFIQIREKDLDDKSLFLLTSEIVRLARGSPCRILVNGRADIALAAGADGVHLPAQGLRVEDLRPWVPAGFLIGCSTHNRKEALRARDSGADYILLGPVFATPSKAGLGSPLGLARFAEICGRIDLPVFGLGGITCETAPLVLKSGAAGIAGIRLFQSARGLGLPRGGSGETVRR